MTLSEVRAAMELIHNSVSPEADVYFGHTPDDTLENEIKITVIATGCRKKAEKLKLEKPVEQKNVPEREKNISKFPSFMRKNKEEQ
jgi:cell division GTPase FtsZ